MNLTESALFDHLIRRHKVEVQEPKKYEEKLEQKLEIKPEIKQKAKRIKISNQEFQNVTPMRLYENNLKPKLNFIKIKLKKCETGNWTIACN